MRTDCTYYCADVSSVDLMKKDINLYTSFQKSRITITPLQNDYQYNYSGSALCSFNGKEKDWESGFHYYGARYYWSEVLTGWLSVDPMADKYPSISPYAYCAWNPIILVDYDGNKIWLIDQDGNRQPYSIGMKTDGFNNYMSETIRALNKLSTTKTIGKQILQLAYTNAVSVDIIENHGETAATVKSYKGIIDQSPSNQEILFDPNYGIQNIESKEVMSPAAVLGHEIGHVINATSDPTEYHTRNNTNRNDVWDTDEEYYNIHTWEHGITTEWKELHRDGHNTLDVNGMEKYRTVTTTGSTSTTVVE